MKKKEIEEQKRERARVVKYVYVVDTHGKPLMPTRRFRKVRLMLKSGQAKVKFHCPFTIQLTYEPKMHVIDKLTLGCDTGYSHIGLSVTSERKEYYSEEVVIDNSMSERLTSRRELRRTRRSRDTRYRAARWSNRVRFKKKGWLALTVLHRMETHLSRIRFIASFLPVSNVAVEIAKFDTQKMENPEISGTEYQNGEQTEFDEVKAYVKWRDSYTCQYCHGKSGDERLNVHHWRFVSRGGSNRPSNLITLCETCHKSSMPERYRCMESRRSRENRI